jgi:16S rRNA processing protein RimM
VTGQGGAETLPFGRLGRPHGVRGEIALYPFNSDGEGLAEASLPLAVLLVRAQERREMTLVAARPTSDAWLVCLDGVESREQAAALTNAELWLPRVALPALAEGEFYVEDLLGCTVVDEGGRVRGTVRATFWNGAQDVLTLEGPEGELHIPAVAEFIRAVDLDARRVVVDMHE